MIHTLPPSIFFREASSFGPLRILHEMACNMRRARRIQFYTRKSTKTSRFTLESALLPEQYHTVGKKTTPMHGVPSLFTFGSRATQQQHMHIPDLEFCSQVMTSRWALTSALLTATFLGRARGNTTSSGQCLQGRP